MHQDFEDETKCDKLVEEETVQELFNFTFNLSIKPKKIKNHEEFERDERL